MGAATVNAIAITVALSKDVLGDGKWYMTVTRNGDDEPFNVMSELDTADEGISIAIRLVQTELQEWADAYELVWRNSRGEIIG